MIASKSNLTRAPITTLSFHPSSNILAIGSADFSVKIVSSSFRGSKDPFVINSKVEEWQYNGPFKNVESMFEVLFTVENLGGWINHVSFENAGTSLLVLPHTNHFKVYDIAEGQVIVGEEDVQWNGLPFLSGYVSANKELILGGFNKKVARFAKKGTPLPMQANTPSRGTSPPTRRPTPRRPRRERCPTSPRILKPIRASTTRAQPRPTI